MACDAVSGSDLHEWRFFHGAAFLDKWAPRSKAAARRRIRRRRDIARQRDKRAAAVRVRRRACEASKRALYAGHEAGSLPFMAGFYGLSPRGDRAARGC